MSSVYAEIKQIIVDSTLIGRRVYRSPAPDKVEYPYAEIYESLNPENILNGDARALYEQRELTVEVHQKRGGQVNPDLPVQIANLLRSTTITVDTKPCFVRVSSSFPVDDPELGSFHNDITLTVMGAIGVA